MMCVCVVFGCEKINLLIVMDESIILVLSIVKYFV